MSGLNQTVCRYYSATGNCFYGEQCNFVHNREHAGTGGGGPVPIPKSQRPCRNITLHGFCKYEGKGCDFNHSLTQEEASAISKSKGDPSSGPSKAEKKQRVGEEAKVPKGDPLSKSRMAAAAGDFIPPSSIVSLPPQGSRVHEIHSDPNPVLAEDLGPQMPNPDFNPIPDYHNAFPPLTKSSTSSLRHPTSEHLSETRSLTATPPVSGAFPEFDPTSVQNEIPQPSPARSTTPSASSSYGGAFPEFDPTALKTFPSDPAISTKKQAPSLRGNFPEYDPTRPVLVPATRTSKAGYYYYGAGVPNLPYPALPHTSALVNKESRRSIQSFFMPENIRQEFRRQNRAIRDHVAPDDPLAKELPQSTHRFHTCCPLESLEQKRSKGKVFNYSSFMYKGISSVDGHAYAIRRIDGLRIVHEAAMQITDIWRGIQHPNIVTLRELFSGKDSSGCSAVFFVYDYHPCSETLEGKITQPTYLVENVLWSFISQILSALRTIHMSGRACRIIHPSKIIVTGKNRLRISGVGIFDIIHYDGGKNLLQHQFEDLFSLGKLILCLACKSLSAVQTIQKSLEFVSSHYSSDLKSLLVDLLSKPVRVSHSVVDEIFSKYALRFVREIEHLHNYTDVLESELAKEAENGRLLRLMTKLGFINERPEFDMDPSWAETDNRYLLKLLRDYIFHQTNSDGTPSVDLAHVIESLNKLDSGIDEKVTLMSRDEQSVLIVSYKDLHNCVQSAFMELFNSSVEGVDRVMTKGLSGLP